MTRNQIEYWNVKETGRHNLATETETNRHNLATEAVDLGNLQEAQRHNRTTEGLTGQSLGIEAQKAAETARHNLASEKLTQSDLNIRGGTLEETTRHNHQTEFYERLRTQADTDLTKAKTEYQDISNTWAQLEKSNAVELTNAQVSQYHSLTKQIDKTVEQIQQNIDWNNYNKALEGINTLNQLLRTGANYVDALIPG